MAHSTLLSTSLPLTLQWYPTPTASAHQTVQNRSLQTGPHNHHNKVLVTYLFGDGRERLSLPSPATIKPPSVRLRSTQTMAYKKQSHNRTQCNSSTLSSPIQQFLLQQFPYCIGHNSSQSWRSTLAH